MKITQPARGKSFAKKKKELNRQNQLFQDVANDSIKMMISHKQNSQTSTRASSLLIQVLNKNLSISYILISQKTLINLIQINGDFSSNIQKLKSYDTKTKKSIEFISQLIESRRVKIISKQKRSQLTLFSFASLMIQMVISPVIWKIMAQNLNQPPQFKSFKSIAISTRWQYQTKEFLLKHLITSPNYEFRVNDFLVLINSKCYQSVYLIIIKFQNQIQLVNDEIDKEKIGWTLSQSFKEQDFLQLKFWISIKLAHYFSYKIINEMLPQKIEFGGCKNPIKGILLYIQFLERISSKFSIQNK